MRTRHVVVVPYDPQWPQAFQKIATELRAALGTYAVGIEHVGSTSVPGLAAKPVIDIDVVIADYSVFPAVRERLQAIGYVHEGDLGIVGREAFRYADKPHLQTHHLYVCPQDSEALRSHLVFRAYLRAHPEAVEWYGRIKQEAARLYQYDIDGYMAHKAPCIAEIYALCTRTDQGK